MRIKIIGSLLFEPIKRFFTGTLMALFGFMQMIFDFSLRNIDWYLWIIGGLSIVMWGVLDVASKKIALLEAPDVSLTPIPRESGKYASIKVTNNNQDKPVWCKAIIRKLDWFKQDPNNTRGGEWEAINTEERGPLAWHHGGSDKEGFKKVHSIPEFINVVKISDDMNQLMRGNIVFTFLVEKPYKAGLFRVWIEVICKSDEEYKTESWLGCIDTAVTMEQPQLTIMECDDIEQWRQEANE